MTKWYSPQLSREIVFRLYLKAKAERIPVTKLANRIIEEALGPNESISMLKPSEKQHRH